MIRKILSILSLFFVALSASAYTNMSYNVDKFSALTEVGTPQSIPVLENSAYVTFRYLGTENNKAVIEADLRNDIFQETILLFRKNMNQSQLKKCRPKVKISKFYPGKSKETEVTGFKDLPYEIMVFPANGYKIPDSVIMRLQIPFDKDVPIDLPIYTAKYKEKKLFKKGIEKTQFEIVAPVTLRFNIFITGWTEDDPHYVETAGRVKSFMDSLSGITFCANKKHKQTLEEQQRPYREEQQKLLDVITEQIDAKGWISVDTPHKAYKALSDQLTAIDFDKMVKDCGKCSRGPVKHPTTTGHNCSYCSLNSKQIYDQLNALLQKLYTKKISKTTAVQSANFLYNCFKANKKRSPGAYGEKITEFYNKIVSY